MPSNLTPSGELLNKSFKLIQDEWKNLWMWLAGLAVLEFITIDSLTRVAKRSTLGGTYIAPPTVGGHYFLILFLVVVAALLLGVGLLRDMLKRVMPSGTNILGYWPALLYMFVSGIIVAALVFAGFVVFIIPGIWLAICFSFGRFEIVANGKGAWSGIVSSFELVKGRWWAVFGRLLMAGLFALLLNLGAGMIIGIVSIILAVVGLLPVATIVSELLRALMTTYVALFTLAWTVNLYRSLKETPAPAKAAKV
jgi:hypothetical protein